MKELIISDQKVRVRATPLALLFYKQEFNADLIGDFTKMEALDKDISKLDSVYLLQLVWAMAKADKYPEKFPGFIDWLAGLNGFDFSDPSLLKAALEEAAAGFFRRGKQQQVKK